MTFLEWLQKKYACQSALDWVAAQPDQSIDVLLASCPRGDWIIWCYQRAGYSPDVLAPVAYSAATRAMGYASDALDSAGVAHALRITVADHESAEAAARAAETTARAARAAARAARASARAAETAEIAAWAAAEAAAWAADAARAAETAARAAEAAEHALCADDCRRMLPKLVIKGLAS